MHQQLFLNCVRAILDVMKMVLSLLAAYCAVSILGTAGGAAVYMLYNGCTQLVAGQALSLFSIDFFIRGLFAAFPVCTALTTLFLTLYIIRHQTEFWVTSIVYFILALVSWGLLIPECFNLSRTYDNKHPQPVVVQAPLSTGYFRKDAAGVSFYSTVEADNTADGLYIRTGAQIKDSDRIVMVNHESLESSKSYPFADSLIKQTVSVPAPIAKTLEGYSLLRRAGMQAFSMGYIAWLCFASMGLALAACACLCHIRSWRMLNVFLVIIANLLIYVLNYFYYGSHLFAKMSAWVSGWGGLFRKIPDLSIVLCNCSIAFVFLVTGILFALFGRKKGSEE